MNTLMTTFQRRRRTLATAAAAGAASLAGAGAADAAVTMGGSLQSAPNITNACETPQGCLVVQEALGGRVTRAPFSGVIVRWRVRGQGTFAIFRAAYVGDDTIVRAPASQRHTLSMLRVGTYSTRYPIKKGQHVGLFVANGGRLTGRGPAFADLDGWTPPSPYRSPTRAVGRDTTAAAAYSADLEPDADADGYGDESQDGCPTNGSTHGACPPPPPAPDTTAPTFTSRPTVRPRRPRARRRVKVRFAISEPATVTAVLQRRRGRRYRRLRAITRQAGAGAVTVRARLRAGRYRLRIRAVDGAGNASRATKRFRVRRRH